MDVAPFSSRNSLTERPFFNTSSGAAIAVLDRTANGFRKRETKCGLMADEVKRQASQTAEGGQ